MATLAEARRIALTFPGAEEGPQGFSVGVRQKDKVKGFCWVWLERVDTKKGRVPQPRVLAIRTASLDDKDVLLRLDPAVFFTEPHYNGYPAVLVHLPRITPARLRPLLEEAWRTVAPKLVTDFRRHALALDGVVEGSHMGHADFRYDGRVLASLDSPAPGWAMVKLTPEDQRVVLAAGGRAVKPASGAWGKSGCTLFNLLEVSPRLVKSALRTAHESASRAPAPRARRPRR
ncbi:MAG: hypothetical protein U0133_22470 [Gemmatimonadales bacterium]